MNTKTPIRGQGGAKPVSAPAHEPEVSSPDYYVHTQTGMRGGVNQDAVMANAFHFFGVADGVGGGAHGEVAAQTVLEHCGRLDSLTNKEYIKQWVARGHDVVRRAIAELSDRPGATTLAVMWFDGRRVITCHVGDSRVYLLRRTALGGRYALARLTKDHTYENSGLEPPENGEGDDPCQMLGAGPAPDPTVKIVKPQRNDIYLLCSDGLHRYVADEGIRLIVNQGLRKNKSFKEICEQLAATAVSNGGRDDISVIMTRLKMQGLLSPLKKK